VLEREGREPQNIYWILEGEILIYKKLAGLYQDKCFDDVVEDRLISVGDRKPLELFQNPKNTDKAKLGVLLGAFGGCNILAGEDSVLFK